MDCIQYMFRTPSHVLSQPINIPDSTHSLISVRGLNNQELVEGSATLQKLEHEVQTVSNQVTNDL